MSTNTQSDLAVVVFIMRTGLEDRTLVKKLAGYTTYTQQTHFLLVPGIW